MCVLAAPGSLQSYKYVCWFHKDRLHHCALPLGCVAGDDMSRDGILGMQLLMENGWDRGGVECLHGTEQKVATSIELLAAYGGGVQGETGC